MAESSLADVVSRVVDEAKEVARAEVDVVKAQAAAKLGGYRTAVILFVVAGLLGLLALIGLVVGALLILSVALSAAGATVIVVVVMLLGAGLLGWLGARRWSAG